jgi:hypothetical protein
MELKALSYDILPCSLFGFVHIGILVYEESAPA